MSTSVEKPERPDAFLSYSRRDLAFVRELVRGLNERGKDVWVDLEDIPKSADWRAKVEAGIDSAKAVVAILSPSFAASQVCGEEIRHATAQNKRLVPVRFEEVGTDQLVPELNAPNWIVAGADAELEQTVDEVVVALETDLAWVDRHARLVSRSVEWRHNDRDRSLLLQGSDLKTAEQWLSAKEGHREQPTELQVEYIAASRRAARRRRRMWTVAGAVALAAPILGVIALQQRGKAHGQSKLSQSRRFAAAAISQLPVDPRAALVTALRSEDTAQTPEALAALRQVLMRPPPHAIIRVGKRNAISAVTFAGNTHVLGRDYHGVVRRWTLDGRRSVVVRRNAPPWTFGPGAATSRAAGLAATATDAGVEVIDVRTHTRLLALSHLGRGLEGTGPAAELSPNGRWLVTAGYEDAATIWPVPTRPLDPPAAHAVCVTAVTRVVVTCDSRGQIEIWSPPFMRPSRVVRIGGQGLDAAATAGGRAIFVWDTQSATATTVDVATGRTLKRYRGSEFAPPMVSPDGRLLFVPSTNGARIENAATGRTVISLALGEFGLATARFDARGDRVVTSHRQQSIVRVWDVRSGRKLADLGPFAAPVDAVAISPNGDAVATASGEIARVWDVATRRPIATLRGHRQLVLDVEFSPDGAFVVTAGNDGTARVWEAGTGRAVASLDGDAGAATFGPGGSSILMLGRGGTAVLRECPACARPAVVVDRARAALR